MEKLDKHFKWFLPLFYWTLNMSILIFSIYPLGINKVQEFIKETATINISIAIGLFTLVVAIAALVAKKIDHTIPYKKELMRVIWGSLYYLFSSLILISISY